MCAVHEQINRTLYTRTQIFSVFLHLKKYLYKWINYFCDTSMKPLKMLFPFSQTFQKEKVAEGSPRAVAHFADSWAFADCALLSHVALESKDKTTIKSIIQKKWYMHYVIIKLQTDIRAIETTVAWFKKIANYHGNLSKFLLPRRNSFHLKLFQNFMESPKLVRKKRFRNIKNKLN